MTLRFKTNKTSRTDMRSSKLRTTKFTAVLVALSLGVSGMAAAPAHASERDVARVVGGLLTLFVVGKVIDSASDKKSSQVIVSQTSQHSRQTPTPQKRKRSVQAQRRSADAFKIPNTCIRSVRLKNNRTGTVAIESCVQREHRSAERLPAACETRARTKRGHVQAYELGCLSNFGYRVSRS